MMPVLFLFPKLRLFSPFRIALGRTSMLERRIDVDIFVLFLNLKLVLQTFHLEK